MAHIREMIIESGKTLEEGGSYRKAGRTMTVAFEPGEWTVSAPPEDDDGNPGDWKPIVNALGKQLDIQVNEALGIAKGKESKRQERAGEEKPDDKPVIKDPDVPLTTGQKGKLFWLKGNIEGAEGIIQKYLDDKSKKKIPELTKGQASELIDQIPEPEGGKQ